VVALSTSQGSFALSPKKDVLRFTGLAPAPGDPAALLDGPQGVPAAALPDALRGAASGLESALTVPLLVLVAAGAFPRRRWGHRRARLPRVLLLGTAAVLVAAVVRLHTGWGYGGGRHLLAAGVLLLPFAGEGVLFLGAFLSRVVRQRRLAFVAVSLVAIPLGVRALLRPAGESGVAERRLGEELARRAGDGAEIGVATFAQPRVAWYADRLLSATGGAARDVPLWGRYRQLLHTSSELADARAGLARTLDQERADWLVLDVYATAARHGQLRAPGRELAAALLDDGVLGLPAAARGAELAAFPVRRAVRATGADPGK
jgi:hypothetical protein